MHEVRLPAEPLVVIQPSKRWSILSFKDIWAYRELLFFLTWRDVKVRYKQTALGAAWAILQPLFMMIIFTIFFGRLAGVASSGIPYPLFALAGLVPWTFFANAITASGNSLVGSANLITKVYFPRLIVPAAAMLAGLVDFLLAFMMLCPVDDLLPRHTNRANTFLPVLILLTALFSLGVGTWMAALNVKYRDVRFAFPFVIQLWLFVSSVILPSTSVPEKWRWILMLNPMSGIIEGYRAALFGLPFDWPALGIASALTIVVLLYAIYAFGRVERGFADIIYLRCNRSSECRGWASGTRLVVRRALLNAARDPHGPRSQARSRIAQERQRFLVLGTQDLDFEIAPGEIVGIIGRNGAGKSTLLKIPRASPNRQSVVPSCMDASRACLKSARVFTRNSPVARTFSSTARYSACTRREIESKFDEIVAFSEVEKFVDTPVKRYSSGGTAAAPTGWAGSGRRP